MNSQFITIEISNDIYAELMKDAEVQGVSTRVVVANLVEEYVKAKSAPDFLVEVNPNFMPSQEQLDAGGGGIEKFFTDEFFKNVHKGFAKE